MATRNKRPKEVIPYAELLGKVQGLLAGLHECRDLHIDTIEVYREQVDGANWHVVSHRESGADNDWPSCWQQIVAEIRVLRESYDCDENSPRSR